MDFPVLPCSTVTQKFVGPRSGMAFSPLLKLATAEHSLMDSVHSWVTTFLSAPNPDLGRPGDVCPYTRRSLGDGAFWISELSDAVLTSDTAETILEDVIEVFEEIAGHIRDPKLLTAVIVMPHLTNFDAIDTVQANMKDIFVSKGLMIGQFYPGCPEPGLWNPNFHPLDAPYPMLAVRHMVPSDFPFLIGKIEWMKAYLKQFAPAVPATARSLVAEAIQLRATMGAEFVA